MAKKINSLLKGVAITGATIGGASILNDSTLAYAQEVEDVTLTNNSGEIFVENETVAPVEQTFVQEQVEQPAEPIQEVPSQPTQQVVELLATPVPLEGEPQAELSQQTIQESNDVALQAGSENLDSTTEQVNSVEMTDEEIYASTSAQTSTEDSEILSTYESTSESVLSTANSMSEAISETDSQYNSESMAYIENGYTNATDEKLTELEGEIKETLTTEKEYREARAEANKLLENKAYYVEIGQKLAAQLIQYKLILDGEITEDYAYENASQLSTKVGTENVYRENTCVYFHWSDKGYEYHHFCVKYLNAITKAYTERYFDYVTCDKDGNSIWTGENKIKDNASLVKGINMVEKIPVYDMNKSKADYYQRTDFEVTEPSGTKKGFEWYTMKQYKEDVYGRSVMRDEISSLSEAFDSLTASHSQYIDSAESAAYESAIASTSRAESLSERAEQSLSASEYKSESLSQSTSTSEMVSLQESSAASESLAAASVAATTATTSATETVQVSSASESPAATAYTQMANFTSVTAQDAVVQNDVEATEPQATPAPVQTLNRAEAIADDQVPLAVVDEQEALNRNNAQNSQQVISEEDTPLAGNVVKANGKWWGWILIIIGLISGTVSYDKARKEFVRKPDSQK